jgi:predicted transcriptional regulator
MPSLVELTASIVASQASGSSLSTEELLKSLQQVHATLKALDSGDTIPSDIPTASDVLAATEAPAMTVKQAFAKKDKVFCLVCGLSFTTLKRHLKKAHGLEAGAYRKQFGIKSSQTLAAKNYVESRRKTALDNDLGAGLEKARAIRKANVESKAAEVKVVTENLPAKRVKAPVPAKIKKAAVPMKIAVENTPAKASKKTTAPKTEVAKTPAKLKKAPAIPKTAKKK